MRIEGEFPRRILLCACGITPQVVTESLYCLRVAAEERFAVNEVHIVTTARGREVAEASLLVAGHFAQLCRDYDFEDIRFDASHIEVIRDPLGGELDDIRSPEENAAAADCITELRRRLSGDESAALHVSLAGGRKTMSYYAGYALSLFGRPQDRLSHVLVKEEYEAEPEFFYPTPDSRAIRSRSGRHLDASRATLTLANIPFVRLRDTLPAHILSQQTSFNEAVRRSNLDQAPESVVLNLHQRTLHVAGELVPLSVKELAFYSAFARECQEDDADFEGGECNMQLTRAIVEELVKILCGCEPDDSLDALFDMLEDTELDPRTLQALRAGIGVLYLRPILAVIRGKLVEAIGERLATRYEVALRARVGTGSQKIPLYGLRLPAGAIRFIS